MVSNNNPGSLWQSINPSLVILLRKRFDACFKCDKCCGKITLFWVGKECVAVLIELYKNNVSVSYVGSKKIVHVFLVQEGQIQGCQRHSSHSRVGFNLAWMKVGKIKPKQIAPDCWQVVRCIIFICCSCRGIVNSVFCHFGCRELYRGEPLERENWADLDGMVVQIDDKTHMLSYWNVNTLSLWVPGWSSLHSLYGYKEWCSVYSGFVLDKRNTRFSVVAVQWVH